MNAEMWLRIRSVKLINMKQYILFVVIYGIIFAACGKVPTSISMTNTVPPVTETQQGAFQTSKPLIVFGASSLTEVFIEIGKSFEALHPSDKVIFNFAGSQALRSQVQQGAYADVIAFANTREMNTLVTGNLVIKNSATIFLTNQLIVILPEQNPGNINSLADLSNKGVKLILASDAVPVGSYSRQVLSNLNALYGENYKNKVLANVVSEEDNVKQVVIKILLGEADAGIVYISDAVSAPSLKTIEIPPIYNIVAKYPIAILKETQQPYLAAEFIEFVLSKTGQLILQKWGFSPVHP